MNAARTALQELAGGYNFPGSLLPKDGGPMIFDDCMYHNGLIFMAEYILALDMAEGLPPRERYTVGEPRQFGAWWSGTVLERGKPVYSTELRGTLDLANACAKDVAEFANQIAAAQPPLPDGEWDAVCCGRFSSLVVLTGDLILYANPLRWEVAEDSDIGCSVNHYTCVARRKEKAAP